MIQLFKSGLFFSFTSGFAIGAMALVAMQPVESRAEIAAKVSGFYSDIQTQIS